MAKTFFADRHWTYWLWYSVCILMSIGIAYGIAWWTTNTDLPTKASERTQITTAISVEESPEGPDVLDTVTPHKRQSR